MNQTHRHYFLYYFLYCLVAFGGYAAPLTAAPIDLSVAVKEGPASGEMITVSRLAIEKGKGRINGTDLPVTVVQGQDVEAIVADLRRVFSGRYSVTREQGPYGPVIIASAMKSADCPTCPEATAETIDTILSDSLVMTVFDAGLTGGQVFALGMPLGVLLNEQTQNKTVPAYEGRILTKALQGNKPMLQTSFRFSNQEVRSYIGDSEASVEAMQTKIAATLSAQGFKHADQDTTETSGRISGLASPAESKSGSSYWQRQDAAIQIKLTPVESRLEGAGSTQTKGVQTQSTRVEIYESSSKS